MPEEVTITVRVTDLEDVLGNAEGHLEYWLPEERWWEPTRRVRAVLEEAKERA